MNRLLHARACFTALENALDDAREDATERGEELIDLMVAKLEAIVRDFDAAFLERESQMEIKDGGPAFDAIVRAAFTNDVIRVVGALARQQNVCREQGGTVAFVDGMDAAREYITETIADAMLRAREEKS